MRFKCACCNRRDFLGGLTLAGIAGLLGLHPQQAAAEPPPETPRLRLYKFPGICLAPQYVAEPLLRAEGFTDVQCMEFPEGAKGVYERVGSGAVDITQWYLAPFIVAADKKAPIVFLSGVHVGCQELVAIGQTRSIRGPQGKDGRGSDRPSELGRGRHARERRTRLSQGRELRREDVR